MNRGYELITPENMNLTVECDVCGAVVPKGKTLYYKRYDLRYCDRCKDINLETKLELKKTGPDAYAMVKQRLYEESEHFRNKLISQSVDRKKVNNE